MNEGSQSGTGQDGQDGQDLQDFNLSYFDTYTSGDVELQREVLELFFGQLDGLMAGLDVKAAADNWYAAAHAIKGGARGIGLEKLAGHCQELEALKDEPVAVKEEAAKALKAFAQAARTAVASQYENLF